MELIASCPISSCDWVLENDPDLDARNAAASPGVAAAMGVPLDAFVSIRINQAMTRNERALEAHFATHTVLEWVTDLMTARTRVAELEAANVSRETSHAHDAAWVDPLRLTLGQKVAAYASPIAAGDGPVAVGTFVHVDLEGSLDRDATVVLDDDGDAQRLLIRTHHFAIWKG